MVSLVHYGSDSIVIKALAVLNPGHWKGLDQSQSFSGATWIAFRSQQLGVLEHYSALIELLLHRCNTNDFPPQGSGFANAAWLLTQNSQVDNGVMLDALCTNKWLRWQFNSAGCGPLAAGLRLLALQQPADVVKRFWNIGIRIRLEREFTRFGKATPEQQSQAVQLLGCAKLCGWHTRADLFTTDTLYLISTLPRDVLPHRPDATKVEEWQFQLWLGLHAFVVITGKPLRVDPIVVTQTLELWRSNLADSSESVGTAEYAINTKMVQWLELCARSKKGLLVPRI